MCCRFISHCSATLFLRKFDKNIWNDSCLILSQVHHVCALQNHLDLNRDYYYIGVRLPMSRLGETLPAPTCQDDDDDVTTSTCCLSNRYHLQPERLQVYFLLIVINYEHYSHFHQYKTTTETKLTSWQAKKIKR